MKQTKIRSLLRKPLRIMSLSLTALVLCMTPGTVAVAATGQGSAQAQVFADAASEFNVPKEVLLAVSYHQTRWETHNGEPSVDGGFGPMNLRTFLVERDHDHAHGRGDDRHHAQDT